LPEAPRQRRTARFLNAAQADVALERAWQRVVKIPGGAWKGWALAPASPKAPRDGPLGPEMSLLQGLKSVCENSGAELRINNLQARWRLQVIDSTSELRVLTQTLKPRDSARSCGEAKAPPFRGAKVTFATGCQGKTHLDSPCREGVLWPNPRRSHHRLRRPVCRGFSLNNGR